MSATHTQPSYIPDISQADWEHIQYYVERLSGLILNAYTHLNPLRSLVVPRIVSSPLLLHSVCSISAQHRANQAVEGRTRLQTEATSYYIQALATVRERVSALSFLELDPVTPDAESLEVLLLSSIFLCMHEIIKSGVENWRQHLWGIESLWKFLERVSPGHMSETVLYSRSLYVFGAGTCHAGGLGTNIPPNLASRFMAALPA